MNETVASLRTGLLLAVLAIFLLLAANFQSWRLAIAILLTVPAVLCGVVLMLLATGTTLNIQSFMGAIMAIGIAVANSILLVTFAEHNRRAGQPTLEAAREAAGSRLRAILMTAAAMICGHGPDGHRHIRRRRSSGFPGPRRHRRPDRLHLHHPDGFAVDLRHPAREQPRHFVLPESDGPNEPIL